MCKFCKECLKTILVCVAVLCAIGCGQEHNGSRYKKYEVKIEGDTIYIKRPKKGYEPEIFYSILGHEIGRKHWCANYSDYTSLRLSDCVDSGLWVCDSTGFRRGRDRDRANAYSYEIATKGGLPVHFSDGVFDTTIFAKFNPLIGKVEISSQIISGPCLKIVPERETDACRKEIVSWLVNHRKYAEDQVVQEMVDVRCCLLGSKMYYIEDNKVFPRDVPIVTSLNNVQYRIKTNVEADHYYLIAMNICHHETDRYPKINKDLISELIISGFSEAESSSNEIFYCVNPNGEGGLLLLNLVAINNDWSYKVVPLGLVELDNEKPRVLGDDKESDGSEWALCCYAGWVPDVSIRLWEGHVYRSSYGMVYIETGDFRGNNVPFIITFRGDVESMTIRREIHHSYSRLKPGYKTIRFAQQESPIHFTYELDLALGDNYIPITVKDKRGNVTEYSYNIKMVPVEKSNPEVNINNDINVGN